MGKKLKSCFMVCISASLLGNTTLIYASELQSVPDDGGEVILLETDMEGCCADENTLELSRLSEEEFEEYAEEEIKNYIKLNQDDITDGDCYLSNGYEIYYDNDPNNRAYFLFCENICIGEMIITYVDGEFASSFLPEELDTVSEAYRTGDEFRLISYDETLFMERENALYSVCGKLEDVYKEEPLACQVIMEEEEDCRELALEKVTLEETAEQSSTASTLSFYSMDVPIVKNRDVAGGLCWCASISSIGAYRTSTVFIPALGLYNRLDSKYSGTPSGIPLWEKRAIDIYDISYVYADSGLTYTMVVSMLKYGRPVYAVVSREVAAHSIVICGYSTNADLNGAYYYKIMDPNYDVYIQTKINSSASKWTYAPGNRTYTTWIRSIY